MTQRGRPLSIAAFVARSAAAVEEQRKSAHPDRFGILFYPEDGTESREIDPREVRTRAPASGRYVFVERMQQADGSTAELERYECRVSRAELDERDAAAGASTPTLLDLRASLDAAIVAQRAVAQQWQMIAEAETRRNAESTAFFTATQRERDARETQLRAELATMTERALKAEAAAAGWKPEHVTALIPLVDRAIGLYQGQAQDRATIALLERLPVELRDQVLDALDRRPASSGGAQ